MSKLKLKPIKSVMQTIKAEDETYENGKPTGRKLRTRKVLIDFRPRINNQKGKKP